MIISQTHRFIFVHVPKSAGTTVTHQLSALTTYKDLELGGTSFGEGIAPYYGKRFKLRKHSTANEIREVVGPQTWSECFTFGFVRNPFARAYSIYKFLRSWQDWPGWEEMQQHETFASFVHSQFFEGDGPDRMLKPQRFWLRNEEGNLLTEFVGRVERLNQDLPHVFQRLGVEIHTEKAGRKNQSSEEGEWRKLYDDSSTVARVVERYRVDFDLFGYSTVIDE